MNAKCPECKTHFDVKVNKSDPPSKAGRFFLVFCPKCVREVYSGFKHVTQCGPGPQYKPERDQRVRVPGTRYSAREIMYLQACVKYREATGKAFLRLTDCLRVIEMLDWLRNE